MDIDPLLWPPSYLVKKHPRARRIKLRASLHRGLEFIVPSNFNAKEIPLLLEKNRAWIEVQLAKLLPQQQAWQAELLPSSLDFKAINTRWELQYLPSNSRLQLIARPSQELIIVGRIADKEVCRKKLLSWIRAQAQIHLLEQLAKMSSELGLPFKRAIIRGQSSRWGSCTVQKSISLNYKLLFFPPELMRHVLIHELCHTVYMDHSIKFWNLVKQFDLHWKEHRRSLRRAGEWIPQWMAAG